MNPQRILVTGGAGFIGSHLVERLIGEGNRVVVIDDLSTGRPGNLSAVVNDPRLELISARVSEVEDLSVLLRECASIYHLAAVVGVDLVLSAGIKTIETNLLETQAILAAASEFRVPLLLTSTSEVYGKSSKPGFAEEDDLLIGPPTLHRWSYACSKLMDEFLAMAYARERSTRVTIARLFNTVGPRQSGKYGMVLPRFIEAALNGNPLRVFGDGSQTRCFCFVGDTIEALIRLQQSEAAKNEVFNIGSSDEITILELAKRVLAALDSKSLIEIIPYDQAYQPGFEDMLRRKPVVEKLRRVTGFTPSTSLDEIIRKTAESVRA
jgi:UDP-glucose 4-epimerase